MAWVGEEYHLSTPSSLRVDPGTLSEVWVANRVCRREKAPCYFLQKELPEIVSRCLTLSDSLTNAPLILCDDTVLPFHGEWGFGRVFRSFAGIGTDISFASCSLACFVSIVCGYLFVIGMRANKKRKDFSTND